MTKPVGVRELLARIRAVTRRADTSEADTEVITIGDVRVDFERFEITAKGETIHLSPKAFGVLRMLVSAEGKAVSRIDLPEEVWGLDVFPPTRIVDNHIAELRAAIEPDPGEPRCLLTVHSVGSRLEI